MAEAALRPPGKKPETPELPQRSETSTRVAKGQKGRRPQKREYLPEIINEQEAVQDISY